MKWMIASDIHGSSFYCNALLQQYNKERADRLLLLGDILYHGPRNDLPKEYAPKQVIKMLNSIKNDILAVRGNCDTQVDQMVLDFPILADYAILSVADKIIFATHGHIFNENKLPPLHSGDILLCGHTHISKCAKYDDYIYMNPGSVSIPKESSSHSFMILENKTFIWKNLNGEIINQCEL